MGFEIVKSYNCIGCVCVNEENAKLIKEFEENKKIIEARNLYKYHYLDELNNEIIKKLAENYRLNVDIIVKIDDENNILVPKMKEKISELMSKQNDKIVEIGTGNSCNSPCYTYNSKLMKECPKCQGKVNSQTENSEYKKLIYDHFSGRYIEGIGLSEDNICTGFRFNNKIGKEDVDLDALFQYFDKVDNEKMIHYSLKIENKQHTEITTEEYDLPYHYMIIDGERFDFPYGFGMKEFFYLNEKEFFPQDPNYAYNICFFYEGNIEYKELGQSIGSYGYAFVHEVIVFICNSCKYKYHIVKTSPFFFRDKSKDVK